MINRILINGVIINPFISNATPALTSPAAGIFSRCRATNRNAAVV